MSEDDFVPARVWLAGLLSPLRKEIDRRGLRLHEELEETFAIEHTSDLERAFASLLRFVLRSVPDGCEIYVAATRQVAPVSRLGAGQFTVRWQVAVGRNRSSGDRERRVVPLRSERRDARALVQTESANRVRAGFLAAGWDFSLTGLAQGQELLARVSRS